MSGGSAWRRFRSNRAAVVGLAVIVAVAIVAAAAPVLVRLGVLADPLAQRVERANAGPSLSHLLGTDYLGRDLLSRTVFGARVSLSVAVLAEAVVVVVGGAVGACAGWVGGRTDDLLMRVTDVMYAFPALLFVLVIAAVVGPGYGNLVVAVGVVSWPEMARLVRAQVLAVRVTGYVEAARAVGASTARLLLRQVAPNALSPIVVALAFGIPSVIFTEAFLSFVGVGLRPPTPSWGVMVNDGYLALFAFPHAVLVPTLAISVTTLAFHLVGDGLRDALDPRAERPGGQP